MIFLEYIAITLLVLISQSLLYDLFLVGVVLFRRPRQENCPSVVLRHFSFAVIIPAHDEEQVIRFLVESLGRQDYPKEFFKVFVIADNCSDNTASVAMSAGAIALKRENHEQVGKQYAVGWALQKADIKSHDAYIIFDADNLVPANFLSEANILLNRGAEAFQAPVEAKNADDSWVASASYTSFAFLNQIQQAAHARLGMGVKFCGTGMGFTRSVNEKIGWNLSSITEDREFTYQLFLAGIKVAWLDKAMVYDEKPLSASQSYHQQRRWVSGLFADSKRYLLLFCASLRQRFDWSTVDKIYTILLSLLVGKNAGAFILLCFIKIPILWYWWILLFSLSNVFQATAIWLNGGGKKHYLYLMSMPIYRIVSLFSVVMALLGTLDSRWRHTQHTRGLTIDDMEK